MSTNETQDNKQTSQIETASNSKSKKKLLLLALLIALPIIGFAAYYLYTVSGSIKVGDAMITRADFDRRVDAYQSFYDTIEDEEGSAEAERTARDAVILYYALKQEAEERGIDVTDEINEQIQVGIDIREVEDREEFFAFMNQEFNLSEDDLMFNYELEGLKQRLTPELLQFRDVLSLMSRYDVVDEDQGDSQQRVAAIRSNLQEKASSWFEADMTADDIKQAADVSKYNESSPLVLAGEPHIIAGISQGLNKDAEPDYFGSGYFGEDWTGIYSLEEDGDYTTDAIDSMSGYFVMYRLESISNGEFASWESYINHVKDNAERFGLGAIISFMQNVGVINSSYLVQTNGMFCGDNDVSNINPSFAQSLLYRVVSVFSPTQVSACPGTASDHHSGWRGNVRNDAGMNLGGVSVYVYPRPISEQDYTGSHMYCGGAQSATVTTNANGRFDTGRIFSCYMRWQADFTKQNCEAEMEHRMFNYEGRNGKYSTYQANIVLECKKPDSIVQVERIPDPDGILTQSDVNPQNVRLRVPHMNLNELLPAGPVVSRTITSDNDSVRVTGSNAEEWQQRTRSRTCSPTDACSRWTDWTLYNQGYSDITSNLPGGFTLRVQVMYLATEDTDDSTIEIQRIPDPEGILTQSDVNPQNVRLRVPALDINGLIPAGPSVTRTVAVNNDPVRVTGSNPNDWRQTTRAQLCPASGPCENWTSWTEYAQGYSDITRNVPSGSTWRVQIMYYDSEEENGPPDIPTDEDENGGDIPISICLDEAVKTISLGPVAYDQSLAVPSGYSSSYEHELTRRRTTETRYVSHQDASSGGTPITLPHSNDSPGRPGSIDLDYRPYEDNYPFDDNIPEVTYEEDYTENKYTATGPEVWEDVFEDQEVCETEVVDGEEVTECEIVSVKVGEDFLGWQYTFSSGEDLQRTDTTMGPNMEPCWDRTFDFNPRISGAQLLDDRESPHSAVATAFIDMDFSTEEPGQGRSDLRVASAVNDFNYEISYSIGGGGWTTMQSGPTDISAPNDNKIINNYPFSPGGVDISVSVPGNLIVGQSVCFRIQTGPPTRGVMDNSGNVQSGSGSRESISCTPPVVNWPYFKIFGNDVVSGGSFGSCIVGGGRISAHSRGQAGVGSTTQYAAFAVSTINGFSSAALKPTDGDVPVPPTGLTFANMSGSGGDYNANDGSTCLPDYFNNDQAAAATALTGDRSAAVVSQLGTQNDDVRTLEWLDAGSNLTLSNGSDDITVAHGARKVIYVDGRLNINSNIIFDSNWVSRNEIPFVMFVAREISIDPGVEQIDGVYVAQPGSGFSGTIRTCSTTGSAIFNSCQNPLVVNGSLLAADVQFTRTRGSLRDARLNEGRSGISPVNVAGNCSWTQGPTSDGTVGGPTCAAEIVNFAPEIYMALTQLLTPEENFRYDSYTTLPPNL